MIGIQQRGLHHGLLMGNFAVSILGWLLTASGLVLEHQSLSGHYYQGGIIAIVHAFTLLTISPAILGVLFQLMPVVVEGVLKSRFAAWTISILWWSGSAGFVISRYLSLPILPFFAVLLILAVILLLILMLQTLRTGRWNIPGTLVLWACLWLVVMAVSGSFMAAGFTGSIPGFYLMKWHAWTGILGWFSLMIVALGTRLVPMFLLSHGVSEKWPLAAGGMIGLAPVPLFLSVAANLEWLQGMGLFLAASGLILFCVFLHLCFRRRMRKKIEPPMALFLVSFLFPFPGLILSIMEYSSLSVFSWLGMAGLPGIQQHTLESMSVLALLAGFAGGATLGMGFKILPFMGWMALQSKNRRYATSILPASLGWPLLQRIVLVLFPLSVLALILSMASGRGLLYAALAFLLCAIMNAVHFARTIWIMKNNDSGKDGAGDFEEKGGSNER